jgi:hypothetical protein
MKEDSSMVENGDDRMDKLKGGKLKKPVQHQDHYHRQ